MQAASANDRVLGGGLGILEVPGVNQLATVHVIGHDGVLDVGQVDTNLVVRPVLGLIFSIEKPRKASITS